MNISNLIALFRIVVVPLIVYLIYQETAPTSLWAVIFLFIAVFSTIIDDIIAKIREEETRFNSFIDPFADKFLIVVILFVFVLQKEFSLFIFLFFIFRDLVVILFRWLASHDDIDIKEEVYWNICIISQITIVLGLLVKEYLVYDLGFSLFGPVNAIITLATAIAIIFMIVSIVHHSFTYFHGIRIRKKFGEKINKEKIIILANRKSRGYKDGYRRRLLKVFSKRRNAPISFFNLRKTDMFSGIDLKIKDYKQIVIAGGDGSFEGALNYKPLEKKSLGFFPLGAGNAFYSYFYKGKRFEYLRSRFNFREMKLDVLELEWEKGKKQTLFLSLGVDAEVMRLSSKNRTQHGLFDYVAASWKALFKAKGDYDFSCNIGGKEKMLENCVNFTFAKIPYIGYGIRALTGKVEPDDGNVYGSACINSHSHFFNKPVRLWGLILGTLGLERPPLFSFKAKKFEIRSEVPFPLQAGGEFLGYTHWVKIKVLRKQKVLVI